MKREWLTNAPMSEDPISAALALLRSVLAMLDEGGAGTSLTAC
jgi:hypothetical protein